MKSAPPPVRSLGAGAVPASNAGQAVAHRPAPPKPGAQKVTPGGPGNQPRRREPKQKPGDTDIVERLMAICTDADPTKLYRNLVKIGQGFVFCSTWSLRFDVKLICCFLPPCVELLEEFIPLIKSGPT